MNFNDIKRSVGANRHDRAAGDAPNMGRVPRMPGTGLPKGFRRKRKKSEGGRGSKIRKQRQRIIMSWSVVLSGSVLVILGLAVWLWLMPKMDSGEKITGKLSDEAADGARVASRFPSPSEPEALAAVKRGFAVRDPEKVTEYFRPGRSSGQEIVDFLRGLESKDGAIKQLEWLSSMNANGLSIEGVVVKFKEGEKLHRRWALLTPDESGVWKIDFDALARTVEPSWTQLLEKQADTAQVRVFVIKDNYYNGPFIDDRQWICYRLASPDTDQILLAYCRTGSPQAAAMDQIFLAENQVSPMTLVIRRVAGAEARQFEIAKVIAEGWVMSTVPFDEGFK